jgi:uridine phosphorylase
MSAEAPDAGGGRAYHIGLRSGEVAEEILLVGDPARADRIAQRFEVVQTSVRSREYVTHTGLLNGHALSVMATGMGPDNTEIAVVELKPLLRRPTIIRVGTTGALQADIALGSLVISEEALRLESVSGFWVADDERAEPTSDVTAALLRAAQSLGVIARSGLTATAPSFYGAQGRRVGDVAPRDTGLLERLAARGVLNLEMEASVLFVLGRLFGMRTGAVCAVIGNRATNAFLGDVTAKHAAEDRATEVALRALELLRAANGDH